MSDNGFVAIELTNGVSNLHINKQILNICKIKIKLYKQLATCLGYVTVGASSMIAKTVKINFNQKIYEKELAEYNSSINKYAQYINSLGLSDLEIIMKVMNDMWSNIEGYKNVGKQSYDKSNFYRLSLYNDGYGVCRHMADDFTARMNAINPDYEAYNLFVYATDVEKNQIKTNQIEADSRFDYSSKRVVGLQKIFGNHMVSCIKIKELNEVLVVDPTNPSIGVLKNGKIIMLSDKAMDGLQTRPFSEAYIGDYIKFAKKYLDSYNGQLNITQLKEKFGLDAQNKVLDDIMNEYDTENYKIK